jgi:protein subunit release factor A
MQTIIVEIRAAEGGEDSKLLVEDQFRIYDKTCILKRY